MSAVRVEETVWITLADGCRLAARIWFPPDASLPAPAVLEYLPYRRRDRHRGDDAILHPALAAEGFVAVRVDLRGSGDSDGVLRDEYTAQEAADGAEVVAWIAAQPWCTGAVGMIGLSWSGFNALRVAALRPPALKAVVTTCASEDRYADDMHYKGGCLLSDNLQYGSTLLTWMAMPPDPEIVGARWRAMWLERLEAVCPPAATWMSHPVRDGYWTAGAPGPELDAAVLAVGGWADGYTNAVLRLLATLRTPRKGLIGPWGHSYPHVAAPGPTVDFVAYVCRWFGHWLRGDDNGIMDEPMLTAWLQESEPPRPRVAVRKGRWIAEHAWPPASIRPLTLHLAGTELRETPGPVGRSVCSPADTGLASGEWCPYGVGDELPLDQAADDAGSLVFDGPELHEPLQLLGATHVRLELETDVAGAQIAVRLVDVRPDGTSARITYGLLDLSHRGDPSSTAPMRPGEPEAVQLDLDVTAYEVPAGHRLRLSVSTAYWPLAVPVPGPPATLTVHAGSVRLPMRTAPAVEPVPKLGRGWSPPPLDANVVRPLGRGRTRIERDPSGETRVDVVRNLGALRIHDVDIELTALGSEAYTIDPARPTSASAVATRTAALARGRWRPRIDTRSTLTLRDGDWHLDATLEARDGDDVVFSRSWSTQHPPHGGA